MNKNIVWISLIFLVPIVAYFGLTKDRITTQPAIAAGDEIIKFASPMCYECQDLEQVINQIMPKYNDKVSFRKMDITTKDKICENLIKEYNIVLVPTTIFKNQDGRIIRRIEGTMKPEELETYIVELIKE